MNKNQLRRVTGLLFIVGALMVNIPYSRLVMSFDYPDILRQPAGVILEKFAAGGDGLIWTWLAFAWVGIPILLGILMLTESLDNGDGKRIDQAASAGMYFGVVGALAQIIGLLRWSFVVPVLAKKFVDSGTSPAMREALEAVFQAVHQYGGVVLGEHIGQTFTIAWMVLVSLSLLRSRKLSRWLPWSGLIVSFVFLFAQGELLATSMPGFLYWEQAGLVGSLLWIGWMIALGISLIWSTRSEHEHTRQNSQFGLSAVQ